MRIPLVIKAGSANVFHLNKFNSRQHMTKLISILLFLSLSLFLPSCSSYNKAQVTKAKFEAVKIGKKLPCCNPFLETAPKTMPSPQHLKNQFTSNKNAHKLLENAVFNFKGGEDPKKLQAPDYELIIFEDYGFYLAGDGAVRSLKEGL